MLIPVLLFIVGLLCLIKGGDWFVDGATGIARRFKVPELLIGATVVSIGTTLPEVMVSTTSAMTGHGGHLQRGPDCGHHHCGPPGQGGPQEPAGAGAVLLCGSGPVCGRGLHHRLLQPPHRHCAAGNVRGLHGLQCAGYEKRPRPGRR